MKFNNNINININIRRPLRVLVGCEFSQIVTKAFRAKGHKAYSCDIIPTEGNPDWHIQDDILNRLNEGWDMLIAFPPCTHLAVSGARYFKDKIADGRQQKALDFVRRLMNAKVERICIENPVGIISTRLRKPDQIIQPWMFGHETTKATCLWLKNLTRLLPTNTVGKGERKYYASGNSSPDWHAKTGGGCGKKRSITYPGVANAMAEQWGN